MDANDPGTPPPTPQDQPESPQESSPLLLPSLRIENFRGFKELTIPKLGRVNLIVGKNGVGKSSLLEAVALYTTSAYPGFLYGMLERRGEVRFGNPPRRVIAGMTIRRPKYNLESLFHESPAFSGDVPSIYIGEINRITGLEIRLSTEDGTTKKQDLSNASAARSKNGRPRDPNPALIVEKPSGQFAREIRLDQDDKEMVAGTSDQIANAGAYIPPNGLSQNATFTYWDTIKWNNMKSDMVRAIKIIAPDVEDLDDIGSEDKPGGRRFFVRIGGSNQSKFLKSIGDGAHRVLGFSLALASQAGKTVLIDEFENGLHWSVQPKVWEVVFTLAERLNVQVFATTHSYDCIEAFQQAASRSREPAYLIRLDNRGPELQAVSITGDELAYITREKIEVR